MLIRTFPTWSLELEINGQWPWQRRAAAGATTPPSTKTQGHEMLLAVVAGWAMFRYLNADHPWTLNSPMVADRARSACDQLSKDVRAVAGRGSSEAEVAARIRAQDEGIRRLIASMNDLGQDRLQADHPAEFWVQDWQTLLDLRETYADDLLAGRHPTLVIPTVDDIPITHRMTELSSYTGVETSQRFHKPPSKHRLTSQRRPAR